MLRATRTMRSSDIASAMELSTAANWNQTHEDWSHILQLTPQGVRCIADGDRIIATTSLLSYGVHLAWIGMVLTRPEYRRQGLARRLVADAVASAERAGIHTLKLDATDEGLRLYESLGFVVEGTVERWERAGGKSGIVTQEVAIEVDESEDRPHSAQISDELLSLDRDAFGASRQGLLESLSGSGRSDTTANGYVFSRPGRTARYLGPCVASSIADVRQLIAAHLEEPVGAGDEQAPESLTWYWDLLPRNTEAVRCAEEFGFTRRRTLWRMRRGESVRHNDALIYAIAGFEFG